MSEFTIIRTPPKWFSWRDIVSLLLGITVLLLVLQIGDLRRELDDRPTAAQFQALTDQLAAKDARIASKDARIRQLTDVLIKNRIPVPLAPVLAPTPSPTPGLTPSPRPSPDPSPGRSTTPRPRPTRPSASPSCLVYVAATCLTPPPTPTLPPFLH